MSQPVNPHTQRSVNGMIGAMIVAVVVAGGWYLLGRPSGDVQPVKKVDWSAWVKAGRTDGSLLLFAPDALPAKWQATSVKFVRGSDPTWHLGMLTQPGDRGKYVGIDEARGSAKKLVETYVDVDAVRGADVTINGRVWQTWTDKGGDYALTWTQKDGDVAVESVLVGGSAPDAEIRAFVATLRTGTVKTTK